MSRPLYFQTKLNWEHLSQTRKITTNMLLTNLEFYYLLSNTTCLTASHPYTREQHLFKSILSLIFYIHFQGRIISKIIDFDSLWVTRITRYLMSSSSRIILTIVYEIQVVAIVQNRLKFNRISNSFGSRIMIAQLYECMSIAATPPTQIDLLSFG